MALNRGATRAATLHRNDVSGNAPGGRFRAEAVQFRHGMLRAGIRPITKRKHPTKGLVMKTVKSLFGTAATLLMLTGSLFLTACNTVEGAGKDIEKGGEAIQKCADRTDPSCKS
jgi:predicted small secreted protein